MKRNDITPAASSNVQTVDELSGNIRTVITGAALLRGLAVKGEVQNFKRHGSGHVYFTLAGRESRVAAVMFRSNASTIVSWPTDGDEVIVTGNIDVYPKGGTYQLYAARIMPLGLGVQQRAREELRTALEREGLFDIRHKLPIPKCPLKVAVVTSPTGAALRDILEVSLNRAPFIDIVLIPATVQGIDAPLQVSSALGAAGRLADVQCVILARGGGAKDDLSPFDDELIVRAVRSCPLPVVTGVGHQIDNSLADLAADLALPTPSAAAEKVFPDRREMALLLRSSERLARSGTERAIERSGEKLAQIDERLSLNIRELLAGHEKFFAGALQDIKRYILSSAGRTEAFLASASTALHAISPLAVLGRGFSICRDTKGRAIRNSAAVKPGDRISIQFHSGSAEADITISRRQPP